VICAGAPCSAHADERGHRLAEQPDAARRVLHHGRDPELGGVRPFILALNGHSDTYTDFEGGDAPLAIHGTNAPSTIGAAASNGCVHIANNLDSYLASIIKPGTLVEIG
jgi:hypothetical protein